MSEKKKMTSEQLGTLVDAEFGQALGAPGGEIARERSLAWSYYLQRPFGDEVEGESSVITADVADVVDGIMPSLLRIFTTADNLLTFDPVGPEDEAQSAQESDYVNYIFFKQNPGFELLYTYFFDGLAQKNGIIEAYADDAERISQETYEGLTDPELTKLMDDKELEVVEDAEREGEAPGPDGITLVKQTLYDVTFRRVSKSKRIRVENVPPEEYRISSDAMSLDPSRARFVGREYTVTRSELLAKGYDQKIVKELPALGAVRASTPESQNRNNAAEESASPIADQSQETILIRRCYVRVDFDGDGRAELRCVIKAGDVVLENEICDRQPFHVWSPGPLPHKHFGRGTGEKVMDIQRVNSTLVRQALTNLYRVNKPGHAVWEMGIGENTLDDLLVTRIGSIARFARPVSESYSPMTVPFTAQASFPMIEFFDKAKRERSGVSNDSQGLTPDALKNIQSSVLAQAFDIGRMKIEAIARIAAETGLKSLFLHIHELVLKHQDKAQIVKLRNAWVNVDPTAWLTRYDMTVNIGLGIGTREQNLMHLNAIKDLQVAIAQAGGMNLVVTPKNIFNTASEYVKNANLKNPTLFFTDPGDKAAPPPSDEAAALQKQQQELQARQQQLDAERQKIATAKLELTAREQQFETEKTRVELNQEQQRISLEKEDLERKKTADRNDVAVAIEGLRNDLTALTLSLRHAVPAPGASP